MKAIVITGSGSPKVLKLREVEKPTPRENEMLVRVHASTVTIGDVILRKMPRFVTGPMMTIMGFKQKNIAGHELAGTVEAVGKDIKSYRTGDHVFGTTTGLKCGANAEYVCIPEEGNGMVAIKPANLTFGEAAAVPIGGTTALQILRSGNIENGDRVLIYGASGSVGTYAVQLAKHFGAYVTGVCSSTNLELVRSIGADETIDYTKEDFRKNGETYDVIFDTVRKLKRLGCNKSLGKNGVFLSTWSPTRESNEDLIHLKELVEAGKVRPIIDRTYPLEDVVEAHGYVEKGHKRGNVIITVVGDANA
ncbi:MAG TPA: NAD(P)-dependent alcohol dehydrogenase [Methanomassiliicoccales archaeon]|nr:NAD(P)-dependent alcohol dehydrogenase [Methanomassiliicoccales archaeon]